MLDNINIITKHLADLTAGNWADYRTALAADAVYEEPATHQRATGADNYIKTIQRWKNVFSDLAATPLHTFASGDTVVIEVEWSGTHDGLLEGPFGTVPPTGLRGTVKAAIVFELNNGKIVETRHYFDLLTVLAQLGVAPAAGMPERAPQPAAPH